MMLYFSRKRFSSGLIAGGFGLLVVSLGGWWFTISVGIIAHLSLLEYFRMAKFAGIRPATKTTLVACQLLLITTQAGFDGFLSDDLISAVFPLSGAAICGWLLLQPVTGSIADIASSIFGLFYLGFLPSHWIRLRNLNDLNWSYYSDFFNSHIPLNFESGMWITLAACLIIVASDIGAYSFGIRFGRTPLSPISPGKTIEGAIGGFVCAIAVGVVTGLMLDWRLGALFGGSLGLLVALFALVGDLTESMMKRNAGIKDSGDFLPGHGGILDRIDSYLFTPAVVYYVVQIFTPILSN